MSIRDTLSHGIEPQIQALRRQRPVRRLAEIGLFVTVWTVGIAAGVRAIDEAAPFSWALRLTSIGLVAAALNAFFLLSHEGHHNLLFRNPSVNHAATVLLCLPLLHAPTAYRVLHELHHRHLGGPGDPDEYRNYTTSASVRWALQWVRLTLGTLVYMPLIPVVAFRRAPAEQRRTIAIEYGVMGSVWAALFASMPLQVLVDVWLGPGLLVGYISAVRAVAQHALTDASDPLLASRSVSSNPAVAFLLLNENYHLEHHLFPEVPSYNLPRLRALIRTRVRHSVDAPSYTRFMAGFISRFLRGDETVFGYRQHAPAMSCAKR